ncbi:MAG: superoxide dismutase [Fe] [Candidatus Accumulibacter sp.]|jgi:Fe-Mn family superoxide dismutase|nr:superoxide dismutase [Fe] [Accumulibacter sp.]
MEHTLSQLPFALDALAPHISRETLEYHYGKHHQTYVNTLNKLIQGTAFEESDLETIVRKSPPGAIYNNAAQAWNHAFYWNSISPETMTPTGALCDAIDAQWKSVDGFKKAFLDSAVGNFGSGWTWLVRKPDASLAIVNTGPAGTPLTSANRPLFTVDVWEHAYYIDYRNLRAKYVETFLDKLVNWDFAAKNFA